MASENQNTASQLYHLFSEQHVQWAYCGDFTSEKTDLIIRFFESFLDQENIVQKIQKRAFYIFVEGIQNVHRHQLPYNEVSVLQRGFLLFQQQGQHIVFTMGNIINKSQEVSIAQRLDSLNKMSKEELNNYYKKILKNEVLSDKGGAGLGLIEIARKSQNLLNYQFIPIKEHISTFYLRMAVSGAETNHLSSVFSDEIEINTTLHQILSESGISLAFHDSIPGNLPEGLRAKTNIILPENYPEWSGEVLFKVIGVLHDVFPDINQGKDPVYVFCQASDFSFKIFSGIVVSESESGNINKITHVLGEDAYHIMKAHLSKPPNIQITEFPGKKQFISLTFSFSS